MSELRPARHVVPVLRLYAPADRGAVRELCCETAYGEARLDSFFPDRELFADLMTRYYLEWEPESAWVAEAEGRVVGYLLGCRDTRRQRRVQATRVVPAALAGFVRRGGLARRATWRLVAANLRLPRRGERFPEERYPAHLHIGLDAEFRGMDLGHRLAEAFLGQLRGTGVAGAHAVVLAENAGGRHFFAQLGFAPLARGWALRRPGQERSPRKIVYGRRL